MSPKSKHRVRKSAARHKQPKPDIRIVDLQRLRVSKEKFAELRNNPDFVTLIQIGRIINALAFCLELLQNIRGDKRAIDRRYNNRTFFIIASYLHEALAVLYGLRSRYAKEESFSEINKILYPADPKQEKILKLVRNTGFHLDGESKATQDALSKLNFPHYDIFSGDTPALISFHCDISDAIDFNYLIDSFITGGQTESEVQKEISAAVIEAMQAVGRGCNVFLEGLVRKLGLLIEWPERKQYPKNTK